ncbi:MAG: hypothetical protein QM484_10725 [Woeseiaceae bacterium]
MAEKENNIILKQRDSLGIETHIKLVDGRELQVVRKENKVKQFFSVDILSLHDKSKKVFFIAWKWLIVSVALIVFTLLMLKFLPVYLTQNKNLYLGGILLFGGMGVVLSLIKFWKQSSINQIFYSLKAEVPIIKLSVGKPTKNIFSEFINDIENRIVKFRSHMDIDEDKQLIGEIKTLRRLSKEGVISKKTYETAKSKLFSGFDSQVINREG